MWHMRNACSCNLPSSVVSFTLYKNRSLLCSYIDSVEIGAVLNEYNVVPSTLELITILQGTNSGCEQTQDVNPANVHQHRSPPKYGEQLPQCESMDVRIVLGSFTN